MAGFPEDAYNEPPVKDPEPSRSTWANGARAVVTAAVIAVIVLILLILAPLLGDWRF